MTTWLSRATDEAVPVLNGVGSIPVPYFPAGVLAFSPQFNT